MQFKVGDVIYTASYSGGKPGVRLGVIKRVGHSEYDISWIEGGGCQCYGCCNPDYYKVIGNVQNW